MLARRYMPQSQAVPGAPSLGEQDIPDPFYDDNSDASEAQRLRAVIRHMQGACRGLLQHLTDLNQRWVPGLAQALLRLANMSLATG